MTPSSIMLEKETTFSIIAVEDFAQLEEHLPAWEDLALAAIEPNVFYESWMLLPALRAYGGGQPAHGSANLRA